MPTERKAGCICALQHVYIEGRLVQDATFSTTSKWSNILEGAIDERHPTPARSGYEQVRSMHVWMQGALNIE